MQTLRFENLETENASNKHRQREQHFPNMPQLCKLARATQAHKVPHSPQQRRSPTNISKKVILEGGVSIYIYIYIYI